MFPTYYWREKSSVSFHILPYWDPYFQLWWWLFKFFLSLFLFCSPLVRHDIQSQQCNLRKREVDAPIVRSHPSNLATITRAKNKDGRVSLYNIPAMKDVQEQDDLLPQYNIYDATPDHSILKHGLAKSLSNFHLGIRDQ